MTSFGRSDLSEEKERALDGRSVRIYCCNRLEVEDFNTIAQLKEWFLEEDMEGGLGISPRSRERRHPPNPTT
jgi:hypothetical protein